MESKSFFSFGRNKAEKIVKLEPESLTDYYDDRKKLIFNDLKKVINFSTNLSKTNFLKIKELYLYLN